MTAVIARVVAAVQPVNRQQRFLYLVGGVLMVSGLFHLAVFAVDGGDWWGPVSWRKPVSFGVSFGLASLSIGWVLGQLRPRRRIGWTIAGVYGVASILEVVAVTVQRWRGVPSHFNIDAPFNAMVFGLMGVSVALITLALLAIFVWAVLDRRPDPSVRLAILAGLALLLAASALGNDLINRGTAEVELSGVIPGSVTIGLAGSGKLAHAVGLHGIQVLGVLAILLGVGSVPSVERLRLMVVATVAYVALFGAVAGQVYAGRALTDLTSVTAVLMVASIGGLAYSFVQGLRAVATMDRTRTSVAA